MKGNEGLKGKNEKQWRPKRPKWKEIKAQKAKMKGNEALKGQILALQIAHFGKRKIAKFKGEIAILDKILGG